MLIEQKIKMALARCGLSQSELARRMGQTPSNLNQKIKRGTLTQDEMIQIASIVGGVWVAEFHFEDGTVI